MHITVIFYNYYFSNKGLFKECYREENNGSNLGLLVLPVWK